MTSSADTRLKSDTMSRRVSTRSIMMTIVCVSVCVSVCEAGATTNSGRLSIYLSIRIYHTAAKESINMWFTY